MSAYPFPHATLRALSALRAARSGRLGDDARAAAAGPRLPTAPIRALPLDARLAAAERRALRRLGFAHDLRALETA
jgi:hypothetical protein